ncbi:hypothetical protein OVN18_07840 [Microcella daejeonensis]|uniref:DUF4190 domain-containing protein n=1 Tax=Microcella daejeonensis TaxID=2994971 RepID=A0A9E8MJ42_9MICO|nr:hypothetical protein [Microcella daejeonensis]WAB80486.1 hypothetical protein OVN18_07840 [Microcella daejeonensis]
MTDADAPYPATPVLVASERPVAPSVRPAVWLAVIAVVALITNALIAAMLCAIGAIVFALSARRELRADESLAGTRRSLAAMIVGSIVLAFPVLLMAAPIVASSLFAVLG